MKNSVTLNQMCWLFSPDDNRVISSLELLDMWDKECEEKSFMVGRDEDSFLSIFSNPVRLFDFCRHEDIDVEIIDESKGLVKVMSNSMPLRAMMHWYKMIHGSDAVNTYFDVMNLGMAHAEDYHPVIDSFLVKPDMHPQSYLKIGLYKGVVEHCKTEVIH